MSDFRHVHIGSPVELWPWARLEGIAKRLGVQPVSDDTLVRNRVLVYMNDQKTCYDLYEVVNALLDRMDAIERMLK
jgi:hypothetical protein